MNASWLRYECSSLAKSEAAPMKVIVGELEVSLAQTTARLNSVCVDLEASNFSLATEREKWIWHHFIKCLFQFNSMLTKQFIFFTLAEYILDSGNILHGVLKLQYWLLHEFYA